MRPVVLVTPTPAPVPIACAFLKQMYPVDVADLNAYRATSSDRTEVLKWAANAPKTTKGHLRWMRWQGYVLVFVENSEVWRDAVGEPNVWQALNTNLIIDPRQCRIFAYMP
jgi:hypothetical protein